MYEARAEPALSTRDALVISYNVNSEAVTTGCVPMSAFTNTVTLPRFIAVPLAAFGDNPGAPGNSARSGPQDYPQIVQRNPSQWFDAWDYPGTGCPPVPGLASVQATPGTGKVTLSWPDAGLGIHYRVYLQGPGKPGNPGGHRIRRPRHHYRAAARQLPGHGGDGQLQAKDRAGRQGNVHRPLTRLLLPSNEIQPEGEVPWSG